MNMKSKYSEIFIFSLLPYLGLILIHILLGLKIHQPHVFADELGYLGNARYLSGVAHMPNLRNTSFYHFGYSLFLLPAFWLILDSITTYKAVIITNALLISTLYFALYYMLGILFEIPKKISSIISFGCCLYPAFILQSNTAWSENAFIPFYAIFILSFCVLIKKKTSSASILFGVVAGFLYTLHPRALSVIPISILYLFILGWAKVLPKFKALTAVLIILVIFFITRMVNHHLMVIGWGGEGEFHISNMLMKLTSVGGLKNFILELTGQLLYLILSTYGLFFIGALFVIIYIWKKFSADPREAINDYKFNMLLLLATTSLGIFFASNFIMMDKTRGDHFIYGRYNEGFLAPYLSVALAALYLRQNKFIKNSKLFYAAIFSTGILFLIFYTGRGQDFFSEPYVADNILGVFPFLKLSEKLDIDALSLLPIFLTAVFLSTIRKRYYAGIGCLITLFLLVTAGGYYGCFYLPSKVWKKPTNMTSYIRSRADIKAVSYDRTFSYPGGFWLYQYILQDVIFDRFYSGRKEIPAHRFVISGRNWPDSKKLNAMLLTCDKQTGQALWMLSIKEEKRSIP
jgi:hypothetical protein